MSPEESSGRARADVERTRRRDAALRRSVVRAGRGLDPRRRRRMVAMGVGDEDVRHRLAAHGIEQRRDMRVIQRPGIDDGDAAAADDVAHRALERERPRIVAQEAPDAGRDLLDLAGRQGRSVLSKGMSSLMRRAHARLSGRGQSALSSFQRDLADLDHLLPLRGLGLDQLGEVGRLPPIWMPPRSASRAATLGSFSAALTSRLSRSTMAGRRALGNRQSEERARLVACDRLADRREHRAAPASAAPSSRRARAACRL